MDSTKTWRYCVVGNITKSHIDSKGIFRYGPAAYVGGTKLHVYDFNRARNFYENNGFKYVKHEMMYSE